MLSLAHSNWHTSRKSRPWFRVLLMHTSIDPGSDWQSEGWWFQSDYHFQGTAATTRWVMISLLLIVGQWLCPSWWTHHMYIHALVFQMTSSWSDIAMCQIRLNPSNYCSFCGFHMNLNGSRLIWFLELLSMSVATWMWSVKIYQVF